MKVVHVRAYIKVPDSLDLADDAQVTEAVASYFNTHKTKRDLTGTYFTEDVTSQPQFLWSAFLDQVSQGKDGLAMIERGVTK